MTDPILYETRDHIAILTFNRPEKRNPISDPDMIEALIATLDRMERDHEVRVAILTGAGKGFSSGGDVRKMDGKSGINDVKGVRTRHLYRHGIQRLPRAFAALEVPVIAHNALIRNKQATGRPKDLLDLDLLRRHSRKEG